MIKVFKNKKGSGLGSILSSIIAGMFRKSVSCPSDNDLEKSRYNDSQFAVLKKIIHESRMSVNLDKHLDTINNSLIQVESDKILSEGNDQRLVFYTYFEACLLRIKCIILEEKLK